MADIYMHSKLSEAVMKDIKLPLIENIVFVGAQGPDPMYYNLSKKEGKEYRYYADRMHDTNTRLFFKNMLSYVKGSLNTETYSFMVGFICHYALDSTIHPYVYHNVGIYKKDIPETHQYRGLHLKFERSIDAVLIQKDHGIPSRKYKLHRKYYPQIDLPIDVCNVMEYTIKNTYGKDFGGTMYCNAVKMMYKNVKYVITDRFGFKKLILKTMNLLGNSDMILKDLSFFNHVEDYDFLNEQKNTWHHPTTNTPSNESVHDLFEKARVFALELIKEADAYLNNTRSVDLDKVFMNLSYNSGLDCDLHDEMKYFNNYRK